MITAIVLAGGQGTRLRDTVPDVPKPMAPINGAPFLEYLLDYWIAQGVERFILSVGYRKDVIIDHFGSSYRRVPIEYAIEDSPLGTGGGLFLAALALDQPFLVLNGDTYFAVDLQELMAFHQANTSAWTFSLFRSQDTQRYMAMDVQANGAIASLATPTPSDSDHVMVSGGVYWVEPNALQGLPWQDALACSLEDDVLPTLHRQGHALYGMECTESFIDIGLPHDYVRAEQVLPKR